MIAGGDHVLGKNHEIFRGACILSSSDTAAATNLPDFPIEASSDRVDSGPQSLPPKRKRPISLSTYGPAFSGYEVIYEPL